MIYYVYQHRKADTNEIFYVGKGKGKRLLGLQGRNKYWKNTVNKHGFVAEIIKSNLEEEFALLIEMELIDTYRKRGINLVNLTNGGEGASGYSHPISEETKKILSDKAKGRPGGFKSEHFTDEMREAVIESNKRRKMTPLMKEKTTFKGLHHTEEHKEYIRQKMIGRVFSEETKLKMSEAQKRRWFKQGESNAA